MKIPRWLVVSMLAASSLAVLAVAVWSWVARPERTANRLCDEWNSLHAGKSHVQLVQPTWNDVIAGRRQFYIVEPLPLSSHPPPSEITFSVRHDQISWK